MARHIDEDLRCATESHQVLRKRLLEMMRLSEQQYQVRADRPEAVLALVGRKQSLLRELADLDAPNLLRASAVLAAGRDDDDDELTQARLRLRAAANANVDLWRKLVESEQAAVARCEAWVGDLRRQAAALERKDALRRAYGSQSCGAPQARFVDRLR